MQEGKIVEKAEKRLKIAEGEVERLLVEVHRLQEKEKELTVKLQ